MAKWKKGESGNRHGRPRGSRNKASIEIRQLLATTVDFAAIVEKLEEKALEGSEQAARILLEFGFGRPRQELELSTRYTSINLISQVSRSLLKSPDEAKEIVEEQY